MSEQSCLFCKITTGEVSADMVHKDDRCIVIRDLNPQSPMHLLVIPVEHLDSLDDASQRDEVLLGHLLRVAAKMANEQGYGESGYRTVINTGAGAGQSVFHLHVHVLAGRSLSWPPG